MTEPSPGILVHAPATPQEMVDAAARTVCAHAKDADEARELLAMLGLEPDSTPKPDRVEPASATKERPDVRAPLPHLVAECLGPDCTKLTRPNRSPKIPSITTVPRVALGMCTTCYKAASAARAAANIARAQEVAQNAGI